MVKEFFILKMEPFSMGFSKMEKRRVVDILNSVMESNSLVFFNQTRQLIKGN